MATTPTMGRPPMGTRTMDTPDDITKRRLYWGIAIAVVVLVAMGLAMRNRNARLATSPTDTSFSDTSISAPAATGTGTLNRDATGNGILNRGTGTRDGTTYPQQQATPGSTGTSDPSYPSTNQ